MSLEDVIYGKNRHLYGGIEPSNMKSFSVSRTSDNKMSLRAIPPDDTVIDGQTVCSVGGVEIIYNFYHEPVDEFDGIHLLKLRAGETYSGVVDPAILEIPEVLQTIFVKAFPYSSNGVYNRSSSNLSVFDMPPPVTEMVASYTYDTDTQRSTITVKVACPSVITRLDIGRLDNRTTSYNDIVLNYSTVSDCPHSYMNVPIVDGVATLVEEDVYDESKNGFTYIAYPSISNSATVMRSQNILQVVPSPYSVPNQAYFVEANSLDREGYIRFRLFVNDDNSGRPTHVRFVVNKDHYPVSETDGEFYNRQIQTSGTNWYMLWTNATPGDTYYCRVFAIKLVDGSMVVNRNNTENSKVEILARKHTYLFGYDVNVADPDPATRVSYPSTVDNANYTPAYYSDTTPSHVHFGSWTFLNTPGKYFMPRPCMIKISDGSVVEYLDPMDYSKTVDGKPSRNLIPDNGNIKYQAMMEWPKIYYTHWETNVDNVKKRHFRVSDMALPDYPNEMYCWCNDYGQTISNFYTSIYPGYYPPDAEVTTPFSLYSISGATVVPEKRNAITIESLKGGNNGIWTGDLFAQHLLVNDLLILITRHSDPRIICDTYMDYKLPSSITTGTLDKKGLFYRRSTSSVDTSQVAKVFGMENYFTWCFRRVVGLYAKTNASGASTQTIDILYKITYGTKDGSKRKGFTSYGMNNISNYLMKQTFEGLSMRYSPTIKYFSDFIVDAKGISIPDISSVVNNSTISECAYCALPYTSPNLTTDATNGWLYGYLTAPGSLGSCRSSGHNTNDNNTSPNNMMFHGTWSGSDGTAIFSYGLSLLPTAPKYLDQKGVDDIESSYTFTI